MPSFGLPHVPSFRVEVDWNQDGRYAHALSDVTSNITRYNVFFGGHQAVEDGKPYIVTAQGTFRLHGDDFLPQTSTLLEPTELNSRIRIRIFYNDIQVFDGFIKDLTVNFERTVSSWSFEGHMYQRSSHRFTYGHEDSLRFAAANSDYWLTALRNASSRSLIHNIPAINLRRDIRWDGPVGTFLQEMGKHTFTIPMENHEGNLVMADSTHRDRTLTISGNDYSIIEVEEEDRSQDVFNRSVFVFPNARTNTYLSANLELRSGTGAGTDPSVSEMPPFGVELYSDDNDRNAFRAQNLSSDITQSQEIRERGFQNLIEGTGELNAAATVVERHLVVPRFLWTPIRTFRDPNGLGTPTYVAGTYYPSTRGHSALVDGFRDRLPGYDRSLPISRIMGPNATRLVTVNTDLPALTVTNAAVHRDYTGAIISGFDYDITVPATEFSKTYTWTCPRYNYNPDRHTFSYVDDVTLQDSHISRDGAGRPFPSYADRGGAFSGSISIDRLYGTGYTLDSGIHGITYEYNIAFSLGQIPISYVGANQKSIDIWGVRDIEYRDWFGENQNAALQARIDNAAIPTNVIKITFPLAQPTKELSDSVINMVPGTYLAANVIDRDTGLYLNKSLLVSQVNYNYADGGEHIKVVTCLHTGSTGTTGTPFILGQSVLGGTDVYSLPLYLRMSQDAITNTTLLLL